MKEPYTISPDSAMAAQVLNLLFKPKQYVRTESGQKPPDEAQVSHTKLNQLFDQFLLKKIPK
ncbi:hypothetical protein [Iodobacter fluviatilis]|uniref:Uncharacterized protein n=1 Tax=Iodobacter fluviatilis TaxID=537 RepID=A0A377Q994_9NEIS|nr:hypothetical protein [Iodobacter fluviatilis]TCU88644.1 hypothetical protein EV682_103228 [Iodobacter fluviatilis]STQ91285.1 Uncharacterised protein [Iodobacter fluviatilis]